MGLLSSRSSGPKALPSRIAANGKLFLFAAAGLLVLGAVAAGGWYLVLRPAPQRADVLLHTVQREPLIVSVTEKGTLESIDNRDIVCRVRAGNKSFSSTIKWVIDDGSRVKPGQLLMILDDSALKDQEDNQLIVVQTALANKIKAEKDVEIAIKENELNISNAQSALTAAEYALKTYIGMTYDPNRAVWAALAGGPVALVEAGTFRQSVDDLTGQVRLAEATVEQNRERAAWAERMVKLSYMSPAQAQAEKSRLDSSVETLRSLKAKLQQLLTSERDQTLTNLILARDNAALSLEKAKLEAEANLAKFVAEKRKCDLLYAQADELLREIQQQRKECEIRAPDNIEPDSMVVYYKQESSRFRATTEGMIEVGAQVKEGQKLLRIPNLRKMQVNTKVHEAMVARIRGDVWIPTHFVDSLQKLMMLNTDPFTRIVSQHQDNVNHLHKVYRHAEYVKVSDGQKATIRVDALPDRIYEGRVRTVANVASQVDSWTSDVKLYQTIVTIDFEVLPDGSRKPVLGEQLKPDMTAEVTITVDTTNQPVLTVPVQAILGGTDMGAVREVFVKTPTGFERRPVKLGLANEKVVEIREGITEGEQVVLNPRVLLAPDDKTRTRDGENKGGSGGEGKNGKDDYFKGDGSSSPPKGSGQPGSKGSKGTGKRPNGGSPDGPPGSPAAPPPNPAE